PWPFQKGLRRHDAEATPRRAVPGLGLRLERWASGAEDSRSPTDAVARGISAFRPFAMLMRVPPSAEFAESVDARHETKCAHKIAIELRAHVEKDVVGLVVRKRRLVGPPLDQRGEDIGDRDEPREVGNLLPHEAVGISAAVEVFMMMDHHV